MSNEQPSEGLPPADQTALDYAESLNAVEFLLATRQLEEAQERAARATRLAHADLSDERGKALLAEMIDLQQHSNERRDTTR